MWRRAVWWKSDNASEEPSDYVFCPYVKVRRYYIQHDTNSIHLK